MRQELADQSHGLPEHRRLRVAIVAAGVRQYDVADRIGMSDGQLSRVLSGRKPLSEELAERIRSAIADLAAA